MGGGTTIIYFSYALLGGSVAIVSIWRNSIFFFTGKYVQLVRNHFNEAILFFGKMVNSITFTLLCFRDDLCLYTRSNSSVMLKDLNLGNRKCRKLFLRDVSLSRGEAYLYTQH